MEVVIFIKYVDQKVREKVKLWAPDAESMAPMLKRYIGELCEDEKVRSFEIIKESI